MYTDVTPFGTVGGSVSKTAKVPVGPFPDWLLDFVLVVVWLDEALVLLLEVAVDSLMVVGLGWPVAEMLV